MRIDSHNHFWKYDPVEYGWIDDAMSAIRRDFMPADLEREIRNAEIDGVVSVQARQSLRETAWLLDEATRYDFITGVVGWVDLRAPGLNRTLEDLASNRKLKAVRHVVQAEPDDEFILRADFNRGIDTLREFELRYDILIHERHLAQAIQFVDRHPDQVFVIDHIAKPKIGSNEISPWADRMRDMARRPNVYCKLSGMVTEADYRAWSETQLRPYFDVVLEAFGPGRLMFGSDWPVCLVACEYGRWHRIVRSWISHLGSGEQELILGGTAIEAYGL